MGNNPIVSSRSQQAGSSAGIYKTRDPQRNIIRSAKRLRVANDTQRSARLGQLLPLFFLVEEARRMDFDSRLLARPGPSAMRKKKAPTAAIIDSQSIRTAYNSGVRGYDAGKKLTGRKRHILVDTLGLVLAAVVHPADVQDRDGAKLVLGKLEDLYGWIRLIWADGDYAGKLIDWVAQLNRYRKIRLEIVKRSDKAKGFEALPKRWIVERTFGWLSVCRRFSKDYETRTDSSEAMIHIAMISLMTKRIAKS